MFVFGQDRPLKGWQKGQTKPWPRRKKAEEKFGSDKGQENRVFVCVFVCCSPKQQRMASWPVFPVFFFGLVAFVSSGESAKLFRLLIYINQVPNPMLPKCFLPAADMSMACLWINRFSSFFRSLNFQTYLSVNSKPMYLSDYTLPLIVISNTKVRKSQKICRRYIKNGLPCYVSSSVRSFFGRESFRQNCPPSFLTDPFPATFFLFLSAIAWSEKNAAKKQENFCLHDSTEMEVGMMMSYKCRKFEFTTTWRLYFFRRCKKRLSQYLAGQSCPVECKFVFYAALEGVIAEILFEAFSPRSYSFWFTAKDSAAKRRP